MPRQLRLDEDIQGCSDEQIDGLIFLGTIFSDPSEELVDFLAKLKREKIRRGSRRLEEVHGCSGVFV